MSVQTVNNWNLVHFVYNNVKAYHKLASLTLKIINFVTAILFGLAILSFRNLPHITTSILLSYSISGSLLFLFFEIMVVGCKLKKYL